MNERLQNNVFSKINQLEEMLTALDKRVSAMDADVKESFQTIQSHLVRIKNSEVLSDDFLLNRRPYNDLSPEKAFKLYQDKDQDFILLDVSIKDYNPERALPEAIKIPLEELGSRHVEIANKAASIWVISEDGTRSILACEILNRRGFYNVNNVSGGYKFWPGIRGVVPGTDLDEDLRSA